MVGGGQNLLVFLSVREKSDTKMVVSTVTKKVRITEQISNIVLVILMVTRIWGKVLYNLIAQTGSSLDQCVFGMTQDLLWVTRRQNQSIQDNRETQTSHAIRRNRCQRLYRWVRSKTHYKHATNKRGKMQENKEVVGCCKHQITTLEE